MKLSCTKLIIFINSLVFLAITWHSGSLFNPGEEALLLFGAKDPRSIALGQWWRLVAPIFLHIGIIHFVVNHMALNVVGRFLEQILGRTWFFLIYFFTGIAGNLCSSYGNLHLGAGASGAIFGFVGVGVALEWLPYFERWNSSQAIKFKLIPGPFTSMALLNIALAVGINFLLLPSFNFGIDNDAHLGGLFSGILLGVAFLYLEPNALCRHRPKRGYFLILSLLLAMFVASVGLIRTSYIKDKFYTESQSTSDLPKSHYFLSQALAIDKNFLSARFARGKLYLLYGEDLRARDDLSYIKDDKRFIPDLNQLEEELLRAGKIKQSQYVKSITRGLQAGDEK